jgi:serine/threonine-protein kinase HipA
MTTAIIKIWNHVVGAVLWDEKTEIASFEFDPTFIKNNWDLAPLMMPLAEAKRKNAIFKFPRLNKDTFNGLPGLLADALPDTYGTTLINAWLAANGRTAESMNPVERLCYIGKRGMGALEFEPSLNMATETAVSVEINSLVEIAQQILGQRKAFTTNIKEGVKKGLEDIIRVGSSAGGARAKAIIAFNEKTKEVRSGQVDAPKGFQHWLLKFDGVSNIALGDPAGYGRIELAYYYMALDCGIDISESRLLEENNRAHFMTKRFDRVRAKEKLHVQTLCAMQHFDFSIVGGYSYEQVFQTIRKLKLSAKSTQQQYQRMVFNVIARNLDDHAKNISFLMNNKGNWQLAPAYDITYSYNPKSTWVSQHNLSINGKTRDITKQDLLKVGKEMGVKQAHSIIETTKKVVAQWPTYAKQTGVSAKQIAAIGKTHLLEL